MGITIFYKTLILKFQLVTSRLSRDVEKIDRMINSKTKTKKHVSKIFSKIFLEEIKVLLIPLKKLYNKI